ncbi:MAG: hypothetical protein K6U04_03795 [Armatimonadetes bacterium]|nr:hypothetical protein [Armatimonadota bacterium]
MWIWSRDKKVVIKAQAIYVDVLEEGQVTLVGVVDGGDLFVLGEFASEEEAARELARIGSF